VTEPFNPLDIKNLAHSIVTRMEERSPTPLDTVPQFRGAGLYALYYCGPNPAYSLLSEVNAGNRWESPIYIGKAVPAGSRRGIEISDHQRTKVLSTRVRQHAASIRAVESLDIEDFAVRWLIVEDIWIPLGESAMLRQYQPVWNGLVDGFGNHAPGAGRAAGKRSRWDTLHPGRAWAPSSPEHSETAEEIAQDIREYLRQRITP
jgi:hypothetical protein